MAINRLTRKGPLFGADPEMLDAVQAVGRTPDEALEVGEAVDQLKEGLAELKPLDRLSYAALDGVCGGPRRRLDGRLGVMRVIGTSQSG